VKACILDARVDKVPRLRFDHYTALHHERAGADSMTPIGAVGSVQGPGNAPARLLPVYLAMDQPASLITRLMASANVVQQARMALPPTPAALLTVSPEACGLINPVVTLANNTQMLLLGAQTLTLIGVAGEETPSLPPPPPGSTLNATA
jgi:hypothetical protein